MTTPKLSMPELSVGQAGKELTHNQALAILDQLAQAVVVDKDLAAPPSSPANGAMYIVAAAATGAWLGQSGKLAFWLTTVAAWTFITPADGWSVWVTDEAKRYSLVGGAWVISSAGANSSALDGLTGAADKLPYFTGAGAMALADYTAAARTFDAAIDAAGQRTALALGTASTATLVASASDTTVGAVLTVGYGGIGGNSIGAPGEDLNLIETGGLYNIQSGTLNAPGGSGSGSQLLHMSYNSGVSSSETQLAITRTGGAIASRARNSGTWLPWRNVWDTLGTNVTTVDTGSLGYGVGSGGTVTQATSKATGVTLNKPSGRITTTADSIGANTAVSFTLTNSRIAVSDTLTTSIVSGATAGAYNIIIDSVAAGSCRVSIRNLTAGALAEALSIQFNIIKGATA